MGDTSVSVIIPVYNCESYIAEAINSVLAQDFDSYELIVVNDGSWDGTREIVRGFKEVQCLDQENRGYGAAVNTGVSASSGKFLAFLDADDIWVPNKLSLQVEEIGREPTDLLFGLVEHFLCPSLTEEEKKAAYCPSSLLPGVSTGTLMIAKQSFMRVGLFDEDWSIGHFLDWYLKAQEAGFKARILEEVLLRRRIHRNNLTRSQPESQADYLRILKKSLDRRRDRKRK